MPRFLCLQRSAPTPAERPSPAEMQELYARFTAWRERFADQLVDLGGRLGPGSRIGPEGADGPFVEVKELVGGFMIVAAADLAAAVAIARACPGLVGPGSGVEVIEILAP